MSKGPMEALAFLLGVGIALGCLTVAIKSANGARELDIRAVADSQAHAAFLQRRGDSLAVVRCAMLLAHATVHDSLLLYKATDCR